MSATGLKAFDTTLQLTNAWLHELMEKLDWSQRERAYHALRAVLHALRDRLPVGEVAALGRSCRCWSGASTTRAGIRPTSPSRGTGARSS